MGTLCSTSSWHREARRSNLFWIKLCSLESGSGSPAISSTLCPTTQWSHLRILLWCPPHLPAAPGDHLPPPPLLLSRHKGLRHFLLHPGLLLHPLSLPGFLIQSALYVVLATSLLRLPLPTVLAGHLLYSAISFLHPICALFLLLP